MWASRIYVGNASVEASRGGLVESVGVSAVSKGDCIYCLWGFPASKYGGDCLVVRLLGDGSVDWARIIDVWDDSPSSILAVDDGCIVTGNVVVRRGSSRDSYMVLFMLSADGGLRWAYKINSSEWDCGYSLASWGDGFYLLGRFNGSIIVFKFRLDGSIVWARKVWAASFEYGGTPEMFSAAMRLDLNIVSTSDGGCLATVGTARAGPLIFKLSGDGVLEWGVLVLPYHRFWSVLEVGDGYLLAGDTGGFVQSVVVYRADSRGLVPWSSWVSRADVSCSPVAVGVEPLSLSLEASSFKAFPMAVRLEECGVSSSIVLGSIRYVRTVEVGVVSCYYVYGFAWLVNTFTFSGLVRAAVRILRPDRYRVLLFVGLAFISYIGLLLPAPEEGVGLGTIGILFPFIMAPVLLLLTLVFLPLVMAGILNPNPIFGDGLEMASPLMLLPAFYIVSCLFMYGVERLRRPSKRGMKTIGMLAALAIVMSISSELLPRLGFGACSTIILIGLWVIIYVLNFIFHFYAATNLVVMVAQRTKYRHWITHIL